MKSFWNAERELYEISVDGRLVAEIAETKTMLRLMTHNTEVNTLRGTYLQRERALREFIEAYAPKDQDS